MKLIYIILPILIMLQTNAIGQTGIEADNLEVIKTFEAQLEEAKIIDVKPKLPKVIPIKKIYDYRISIVPLELTYPAPIIKPLAMTETNTFDADNHFIRLGYGTVNDPIGLLRLSFHDGDRYKVNLRGGYQALDNTSNVNFQKMSAIDAGVNGFARLTDNVVFNFDTDFDLDNRSFFDTRSDYRNTKYGEERTISQIRIKAGIANIDKSTSGINYQLHTMYGVDNIADEVTGSSLSFEAIAEKRTSDHINIIFPLEVFGYATNLEEVQNDVLGINFSPKIHFQKNRFMATIGADLYYDNQLEAQVWPEAELAYGLAKNFIQIVVGTKQDYRLNTINYLANFNPWVDAVGFDLKTTLWKEYYGGIRGELNFLSYQLEGGFKESTNDLLVVNEIDNGTTTKMITLYDNINAPFVRGNIDFSLSSNMTIGGALTQNIYTTATEEKAWGLPSLEFTGYFNLNMLHDKLRLKSILFLSDKVYTREYDDSGITTIGLNNLVELDAELSYWPISSFGLFGYANNLLDNKYQRWHGLPTVGINFGGGLQAKF